MTDKTGYLNRLLPGMEYKLFFAGMRAPTRYLIDFGCADGALLAALRELWPHTLFVGVERNTEFMDIARSRNIPGTYITDTLDKAFCLCQPLETAVLFSSVLHEIGSESENGIETTLKAVESFGAAHIIVRDMGFPGPPEKVNPKDILAIKESDVADLIPSFQENHGEIDTTKSLSHFLLKCWYRSNWETEVQEDYFASSPGIIRFVLAPAYRAEYTLKYSLPFLTMKVWDKFGIHLPGPTHYNIILTNNKIREGR